MADLTFDVWAKYWPARAKTRAKLEEAIDAILLRRLAVRTGAVEIVQQMLPERITVTVRDAARSVPLDHSDVATELAADGARQ